VRQNAGVNFAGIRRRAQLRGSRLTAQAGRFAYEGRPIIATEPQRFVILNAITLGASFHMEAQEALSLIRGRYAFRHC